MATCIDGAMPPSDIGSGWKMLTPPPLGERVELADRVVHLAGRDRDGRAVRHLVHGLLAVARRRLLPPVDVEVGELLRRLQRGDLGEAGMHVDQDQRVRRQLVAQRPADVVGRGPAPRAR